MRIMSKKNRKYQPDRTGEMLCYRMATATGTEPNAEQRSLPLVLATETPVDTFDFQRMEVVEEVLRIDGVEMPEQIPLLDSHDRGTVRSVLGSIRDLKKTEINGVKSIIGTAYFGSDDDQVRAFGNYRDGHLRDFSVGAKRREVKWNGNQKVVVRSRLLEGSAVVIGADPNAKAIDLPALRAYTDPDSMKEEAMNEELKALLVKRGMPENLDGADALKWIDENLTQRSALPPAPELKPPVEPPLDRKAIEADVLKRVAGIDDLCRTHGIEDKQRLEWISGGTSINDVAVAILKRKAPTGVPVGNEPISGGKSQLEKFGEAARDALVMRCLSNHGLNPEAILEKAKARGDFDAVKRTESIVNIVRKPSPGADQFRYVGLADLARLFVEEAGQRTLGLAKPDIVRRALRLGLVERDEPGFHTTGSLTNVLLDASNKTLLAAYDEAPVSYPMWVRQAPSAADFKSLNRIRFGELPDPEVVPENGKYKDKATSDARESYKVEKYGELFSISWEAIVNDDLNAISRIPQMQGNAMRRKINKVVYAVLTDNAALSDGIALFHATSHGANLDANALAESALDTGWNVMSQQTGLSGSGTILNIRPSYLIVPAALAPTAYRLVGGNVVPTAAGTNVPLYGAGRDRPLMVVEEGQLDATSTTAWYLAAPSNVVDTIELTFLQGEESPVLEREQGFDVDAVRYKIRQTFAAKAIDYRGLYQGNS